MRGRRTPEGIYRSTGAIRTVGSTCRIGIDYRQRDGRAPTNEMGNEAPVANIFIHVKKTAKEQKSHGLDLEYLLSQ